MEFQVQTKRTPTADWSRFGPIWPDRDRALKEALRVKELVLGLKRAKQEIIRITKDSPSLSEIPTDYVKATASDGVAVRVIDENGTQIWESQIGD